jgi:aquaporin Z
MELTETGLYLFFTCIFATLLQHPASPIRHLLPNAIVRRACFGISTGATIVAVALTPWEKQSGGHLNPAMTLTFCRLGKMEFWDAIFYGVAQFTGATAGVAIASALLLGRPGNNSLRRDTSRNVRAWCRVHCRVAISFALMLTVCSPPMTTCSPATPRVL